MLRLDKRINSSYASRNTTSVRCLDYTIVVTASASQPSPLLFLAPYAGVAMAEEFMYQRKHVLIVYDDLSKQAVAYRELVSLASSSSRS